MAVLLTVLGAVSSGFWILFLDQCFDKFEANSFREELERVGVAFALERSAMSATILDYARWDDAERFVLGKAPDFVEDNFSPESLRNLGYSAFAFSTMDGRFIAGKMLAAREQVSTIPAKVREKLQSIAAGSSRNGTTDSAVSMFWIDGQAFLVSLAPVTDSARKHAPNGYLFFLRKLDKTYLDKLRSLTSSDFSLIETPENQVSQPLVNAYWQDGQERWKASLPLAGWPAAIVVDGATHMADERSASYTAPAWNSVFMVFASLCGVYLILHRRVLKRLRLFSRLSDRYHHEGNLKIRWPVSGSDELDRLGTSLNDLMARVESQHGDLEHMVEHDYLTGIGNRRLLLDRLAAMQSHAQRVQQSTGSLLVIDLDGFKEINDRLGHAAGDEVLKVVARRLQMPTRDYDTVTRLGGDEFAILLQDIEPPDTHPFAHRILKIIEQPIEVMGRQVRVGCSGGIARVSAETSPAEVLHYADLAMYEAKRLGKARFVEFDVALLGSEYQRLHPSLGDARAAATGETAPDGVRRS